MAQLISRQITATSNKLKQSVLLYNTTMKYHTSAASKYPKHLDVLDTFNIKSTIWECMTDAPTMSRIPAHTKRTLIDLVHRTVRAEEEIVLIKKEMVDTVMYFHAQMKHLEQVSVSVSPVITGDTDTYSQGLFALVKCKQQRIGALYQRSYNKFIHYTILPAYDMVEDEENKESTDDQTEEEVSGEEDEQTEDNVSGDEQDLEDGTGDEEMERATSSHGSQADEDSGNDSEELDMIIALLDQEQALESSDESETD